MQRLHKWIKWGLMLFVVPPLCGFWWWLGQGASADGTVAAATVSGMIADATAGGAVGTTGAGGTNAPYVQLLACQRS